MNTWFIIVVGLIVVMYGIETLLSFLNYHHRLKPLPNNVRDIYSFEQYQKWQRYFGENTRFSIIKNTFNIIVLLTLLLSGFFPFYVSTLASIESAFLNAFVFVLILNTGSALLNVPFSYYRTFSIETRYGFNKSSKKIFVSDTIKSMVLGGVLIGTIAGLLALLYTSFGEMFILYAWILLVFILILLFTLNTKVFIKIFNKLTPLPEGELKTKLNALAERTGFKAKAIYSMDASKRSSKLNAFFSGFGPIREIGLFDTLIEKLDIDEISGVLAHEIGHAKHFDEIRLILQQIVVFGLYALMINFVVSSTELATAFGLSEPSFAFGLVLFTFLVSPIEFLLGIPTNYLSRKAEYAADAFAAKLGYRQNMITALKKLTTENFGNLNPHRSTVLLTYSHPPMHLRLAALESLKD